jgi:PPOX class probable FMN-dependent enzyme
VDLFDTALTEPSQLEELYEPPSELVANKTIDHLDVHCRHYLSLCRFALVASADAEGRADVTPRGGPAGFISVLDDRLLAVPDATGNRRLDTFRNVLQTGRAGPAAAAPRSRPDAAHQRAGLREHRPELLGSLQAVGKPPRAALVLAVEEVFTHCPKAFVRSGLWDPASWPAKADQPSPAAMLRDHVGDPRLSLEDAEQRMVDAVTIHLA